MSNRKEKLEKLENAISTLKSEYVGLDEILDEVKDQITSWYVTPEVINRPIVISLWGMTGTGKTSLVKRLVELLDLSNRTFTFDCGECSKDGTDLSDVIYSALNGDFGTSSNSFIFVWDEFQNARTINEDGTEEIKPSLRPIWSLLDSGTLELLEPSYWSYQKFCTFVEDLAPFAKQHPDIIVKSNEIRESACVKEVLEGVGVSCFEDRQIPGVTCPSDGELEGGVDPYRPLTLLDRYNIRTIITYLNVREEGLGSKEIREYIDKDHTLGEVSEWLSSVRSRIARPGKLDCSKSLVFVIGNLDEAFKVEDEINPDFDADTFHEITKRVSTTDIKEALKKRFRAEQIARLGNNLIKYPTLDKNSFKIIIRKEVDRILKEFKEIDSIEVCLTESIYDLLYSEGVYPTQGVRPVFTTIGCILTPYLSKILIERDDYKKVKVSCSPENSFRQSEVEIILDFDDSAKRIYYTQHLQLGKLRDPQNRKRRVAASVHEAGHAIMQAYLTGKAPDLTVSVSVSGGGFCNTYDKELDREIDTREDVENRVMISLAGYIAESLFFERGKCLLGSGSDLESAWEELSTAVYKYGFFDPVLYSNFATAPISSSGGGISDTAVTLNGRDSIQFCLKKYYSSLMDEVKEILKSEKRLLTNTAKELVSKCSISESEFFDLVKAHGNRLTLDHMERVSKRQSPDYYNNALNGNKD